MLQDLSIRNFAIIEDLNLSFEAGFTTITGETGAGKSILVDALALLAGGRASSEMLRHGADKVVICARFGIDDTRPEIILRREMSADGKSRAYINDEPATARAIALAAESLLAIHGQGGERGLLDAEAATDLLDGFGELSGFVQTVAEAASRFRENERRREELTASRLDRGRRLDRLRFETEEIEEARLEGVDEDALASERHRLAHAGRIRELSATALSALSEGEWPATDRVGEAFRALAELTRIDASFADLEREAGEIKSRIADLVRAAAISVEADPERLAALETRLEKIARLKKKYGASIVEILEYRDRASAELNLLSDPEGSLEQLEKESAKMLAQYQKVAAELSTRRGAIARQLSALVQKELEDLAMGKAKFRIDLLPRGEATSPRGNEIGVFLFAPNPGEPEKPLSRIASGGELSRVQLAVETARLSRRSHRTPRTLIFDEVDAGVGGRVAEAIGKKLKALSREDQVLCVTHVPQIAALADRQLRAVKRVSGGRTRAALEELPEQERVEEIARMLAGRAVTATAREHARVLLEGR